MGRVFMTSEPGLKEQPGLTDHTQHASQGPNRPTTSAKTLDERYRHSIRIPESEEDSDYDASKRATTSSQQLATALVRPIGGVNAWARSGNRRNLSSSSSGVLCRYNDSTETEGDLPSPSSSVSCACYDRDPHANLDSAHTATASLEPKTDGGTMEHENAIHPSGNVSVDSLGQQHTLQHAFGLDFGWPGLDASADRFSLGQGSDQVFEGDAEGLIGQLLSKQEFDTSGCQSAPPACRTEPDPDSNPAR